MFRRSIKWRFVIPFVLIIIAVTTFLSVYLSNRYTRAYYEDTRSSLTSEAELMAAEIAGSPESSLSDFRLQEVADRYADNLTARVTIILPDGKVVAETETNPDSMVNHLNRPEVQEVINGESGYNIRYSTTLKTQMMYVAVGQRRDGQLEKVVRLAKPLAMISPRVKEIRQVLFFGAVGAIFLAVAAAFIAANITTAPIRKLTRSAKAIAEGDYSYIPETGPDNEINDLTRAFAHMAVQMKDQLFIISSQKEKLERIVDRLMDGLIIVNHDGKIELINQTARSMFEVENRNQEGNDFIKSLQNYQLVELWQQTLQTNQEQQATIENQRQGKHFLGLTATLGTAQDGGVLILLQDRTKHKQLEEMRQTFVSNVSHELRTPLTSMKALTETLQQCITTDPQNAERFLNLMDVEIDKLTQMVMELLELSRIESGRVDMKKAALKVRELLQSPVDRMRLQAERSKLDLTIECSDSLPVIQVDKERMEQVLINIIHNAIRHTLPGGKIIVSAEQLENEIIIRIKDTGEGISEKDLPRIFERFYKTDQARTSGGTGLGLAIAKHIVEAHNGRIWAESVPGLGSTFSIALPLT